MNQLLELRTRLVGCFAVLLIALGCSGGESPEAQGSAAAAAPSDERIVELFYHLLGRRTPGMFENKWLGIQTWQHPFDVWITQEIITETKPDVVLETGTHRGGSAILWAMILEYVQPEARVITIDIEDRREDKTLEHPLFQRKVDFLLGGSTDPAIVADVKRRVAGKKVMVILDSLHTRDHVLEELRAYASLVPKGGYVIVQDSTVNGHPYRPNYGPGPWEAIEEFLASDDRFVSDRSRERWLLTNNPTGFLKRVK
jgi:cephalosporin hydroxylase